MLQKRHLRLLCVTALNIAGFISGVFGQTWNAGHKVGTVNGTYNYSLGQIPAQLVEISPAGIPNTGLSYQWESSSSPLMTGLVNLVATPAYTFAAPLAQ